MLAPAPAQELAPGPGPAQAAVRE
eukprot:COSAG04_NODE_5142_length_1722_cov_1.274184_1_plen_23_part_10